MQPLLLHASLKRLTFHVERLQHEEFVVAGLVKEGSQPGFIPDPGICVLLLELLVSRHYNHSRKLLELGGHLKRQLSGAHKHEVDITGQVITAEAGSGASGAYWT